MTPRARRSQRFLVKWTLLTALALLAGGSLGSAYVIYQAEADAGEPLSDTELRRGDIWPPTAPVLVAPADGSVVPTATPVFDWDPSYDNRPRLIYVLEFSTDARFRDDVLRITVSNIEETRWETPDDQPFAPGVTWYWRAYSVDEGLNQSPFSETWSFTPLPVELPDLPVRGP